MAAPDEPYVDTVTTTTYGTIKVNTGFSWYNSGSNSCDITGVSTWCTASEYKNIAAGTSASAQVKPAPLQPGTYGFASSNSSVGNPSVSVHAQHK